jgi:hypothetical protein
MNRIYPNHHQRGRKEWPVIVKNSSNSTLGMLIDKLPGHMVPEVYLEYKADYISPGQFPQALDHQGDAHCQQSHHDDPLPEMEEEDHYGEHCQDQCQASHRLDKSASQKRLGYDKEHQDDRQASPNIFWCEEDERCHGK